MPDQETADEKSASTSSEMEYFRSRLGLDPTVEWLRDVKASGRKVIGVLGWGVPLEIVLASGAVPVQLFGAWEDANSARRKLLRDTCPLAASSFAGADVLSRGGLLDAVVVPGTCDWKRKLAELLAQITTVLTLQPPFPGSPSSPEKELKNFARDVALVTDLPLTAGNLRSASVEPAAANEALAGLQRLRQHPSCALSGSDALAVEQAFMRDDLSRWMEHCRSLVRSLEQEWDTGGGSGAEFAPRILLVGSPVIWRQRSLVHLIEEAGGEVVGEDFHSCLSHLYLSAFSSSRSSAGLPALAARWARTCFCSLVGGEDESFILRAIEHFGVDGVIGHTYRSCARLQMRMPDFLRRLSEKGIPCLALETADDPSETGRLLARIEPFVEMLNARRRAGV